MNGNASPSPSCALFVQQYLAYVTDERQLAVRTIALYTTHLHQLLQLSQDQRLPIEQVQQADIRKWMTLLHRQGHNGKGIALILSCWRSFYRWMTRHQHMNHNPVQDVSPPKSKQALPKALPVDDAVQLASHQAPQEEALLQHLRNHCIVEMLYGCGLRLGELLSLNTQATRTQLGWVDLQANDVHVWGKGQRKRVVPLGAAAAAALKQWLHVRTTWAKPAPPAHARHTPEQLEDMALFINPQGQRLSPQHTRRIVKQWALAAGISTHVHPHMLRHSFASHLLQSSGDIRAVQDLLGHANISTTQVYTRLDFQHLATAYDAAHPRAHRKPSDSS